MEGEETCFFLDTDQKAFDVFRSMRFRSMRFKSTGFKSIGFKSIGFKSIGFKSIGFKSIEFYPCSWTSWKAVLSKFGVKKHFFHGYGTFQLIQLHEKQKNPWSIQSLKIFFSVFKKIESYLDFRNRELTFFWWKERKLFFLDTDQKKPLMFLDQ